MIICIPPTFIGIDEVLCTSWGTSVTHCSACFRAGSNPLTALTPAAYVCYKYESYQNARRYNFSEFAIKLNEVTPGLEKRLAPTDCRLRPDQHYLELGMYDEVSPPVASSTKHQSEMPGCIAQAAGLSLLNRMLKLEEGYCPLACAG